MALTSETVYAIVFTKPDRWAAGISCRRAWNGSRGDRIKGNQANGGLTWKVMLAKLSQDASAMRHIVPPETRRWGRSVRAVDIPSTFFCGLRSYVGKVKVYPKKAVGTAQ